MPFAVDEHPVGALGSRGAYPSLGITVRARAPRRDLVRRHALASENRVEGTGELGVAVPDQEAEAADSAAEVQEQVAGLLGPGRSHCLCTGKVPRRQPGGRYRGPRRGQARRAGRCRLARPSPRPPSQGTPGRKLLRIRRRQPQRMPDAGIFCSHPHQARSGEASPAWPAPQAATAYPDRAFTCKDGC